MPCGCGQSSAFDLDPVALALSPQYRNAANPLAHYDSTAEEILQQCDGLCPEPRARPFAALAAALPGCREVGWGAPASAAP